MRWNKQYTPPTVTVDLAFYQVVDDRLCVLLLNRPNQPFKGRWALPGGYVPCGETTLQALQRIVLHKIGVSIYDAIYIDQLHVFDAVARDPRGHAVSISYIGADDAIKIPKTPAEAALFPVDELPDVVFGHDEIIQFGREKLIAKIDHTNLIKAFLPPLFTMSDLRKAYEAVLGRSLDKRNFRKQIAKQNQVADTGKTKHNTNSRPAKLYKFRTGTIDRIRDTI
jgi:8-oxo-dGTP diphosphatase